MFGGKIGSLLDLQQHENGAPLIKKFDKDSEKQVKERHQSVVASNAMKHAFEAGNVKKRRGTSIKAKTQNFDESASFEQSRKFANNFFSSEDMHINEKENEKESESEEDEEEKLPLHCQLFGKTTTPQGQTMVKLEPIVYEKMTEGMQEYLYLCKNKDYGEPKEPIEQLLTGMINEDSIPFKIFERKLEEKRQDYIKQYGQDPGDKEEAVKAAALARKMEKEKEIELARKRKIYIPKYFFHTESSVQKVENCINKSHQRRVRKQGLKAINADDKQQKQRMDIDEKKIKKSIGQIETIEAVRETTVEPNLLKAPYIRTEYY